MPITTIKVPREQSWFWTKKWQEKERQADEDLANGKFSDFDNLDALMKDLNRDH